VHDTARENITIRPQFAPLAAKFAGIRGSKHHQAGISDMRKILFAGALALAAVGLLSVNSAAVARDFGAASLEQGAAAVDIARVKHALHLTAEQERYWPPVESALRGIARRQAHAEAGGLVHRISHRVVSIVLNGTAVRRLAVAARPLIAALRDDQKQSAVALAQEMGLGPVLAALN
jgi:hypothetical protein